MVEEFPSNSRSRKEVPVLQSQKAKSSEPKKLEQIATGKVIQRKRPIGVRFKEYLIGSDSRDVLKYVRSDVLLPRIRDLIFELGNVALERRIYGETYRPRGRGGILSAVAGGPVRYDGFASSRPTMSSTPPWRPEPQRSVSPQARAMHDFQEIILENRGQAERVIETLFSLVDEYQQATLVDLYSMVGITPAYTDEKYGWTSMEGSRVRAIRGNQYLLELPRPIPLEN